MGGTSPGFASPRFSASPSFSPQSPAFTVLKTSYAEMYCANVSQPTSPAYSVKSSLVLADVQEVLTIGYSHHHRHLVQLVRKATAQRKFNQIPPSPYANRRLVHQHTGMVP